MDEYMSTFLIMITLLAGCACILLLSAVLVECASDCSISENGQTADCSFAPYRTLHEIPQDLSTHITILDLSGNPLVELREKSFTRYLNLNALMLRNIRISLLKVDLYLFRPLKKLKLLNLTRSLFTTPYNDVDSSRAYFYWPTNLVILDIKNIGVNDIDLSQLKHLKELHASYNQLLEFPVTHELAPLTYVDLDQTFLEYLSPETLAPYCQLQVLNVHLHAKAKLLLSPARYCICKLTNLWITSFKIKGQQLPCVVPSYGDECEETFSEDTLLVYNQCLERYKDVKSYTVYIIIAVVIILLLSAAGGFFFYYYYVIKPSSDESLPENDASSSKQESPKIDPAELETDDN